MSNIAIVFWSATGNTEAMADAVKAGAQEAGAEVSVFSTSDFSADKVAVFDAIAFGCPAMGDEVLEEDEFQPMFDAVLPSLSGKKVALFAPSGGSDITKAPGKLQPLMSTEIIGAKLFRADESERKLKEWIGSL